MHLFYIMQTNTYWNELKLNFNFHVYFAKLKKNVRIFFGYSIDFLYQNVQILGNVKSIPKAKKPEFFHHFRLYFGY